MALPVTAKSAPIMIMVVRRIPLSGSSTRPYACASVSASGMIIINAPNTTAPATEATPRTHAASSGDRLKATLREALHGDHDYGNHDDCRPRQRRGGSGVPVRERQPDSNEGQNRPDPRRDPVECHVRLLLWRAASPTCGE